MHHEAETLPAESSLAESRAARLRHIRLLAETLTSEALPVEKRKWHPLWRYSLIACAASVGCLLLFFFALTLFVLPLASVRETVVEPTDAVWRLRQTAGYQALHQEERRRLLRYVGGSNMEVSFPARLALEKWLNRRGSEVGSPEVFRQFLRKQPGTLDYVASMATYTASWQAQYTLSKTSQFQRFPFGSKRSAATAYEFRAGSQRIRIVQADVHYLTDKKYHTAKEVAHALAQLPSSSLNRIREVHIEPTACPFDAYRTKRQDQQNLKVESAYMSASYDGVVYIYPTNYTITSEAMVNSLLHEVGHVLSLRRWGYDANHPAWQAWRAAMKQDGLVPSQYARFDMLEDFAETYLLYHLAQGGPQQAKELRHLFPKRFALIDRLLSLGESKPDE